MVSAACQECHIVLIETNSGETEMGAAEDEAVALGATAVSNSWNFGFEGTKKKDVSAGEETEFDVYLNHPGVPILFSGGDYGYAVRYPAVSRYVIAVGGTTLSRAPETSRGWREEVWSNPAFSVEAKGRGTGSGCSKYESKPKWQTDNSCAHRIQNDVSAVADPRSPVSSYDSEDDGWRNVGGTSASAPFVAGVLGLSSPYAISIGTEAFYRDQGALFDVTEGNDGSCVPPSEDEYFCTAEIGYDGPTGNGTPDGPLRLGTAPSVVTGAATGVTSKEAALSGTVNPNGVETTYHFEYGPTTEYGTSIPVPSADVGLGTTGEEVRQTLHGLLGDTAYHYRLVATNGAGTSDGEDQTFTTLAPSWRITATPNPEGWTPFELHGVSCASTSACIASGTYGSPPAGGGVVRARGVLEWRGMAPPSGAWGGR